VLALILNVVAGVLWSPVSAVRRVRVEGAPKADEARLAKLLQGLRGTPCARIDPRIVESEAMRNPEIRGASLARTPFGSAVLRVAHRTPVARLFAGPSIGLTEDGILYPSTSDLDKLPLVKLPEDAPDVGLTLGNGWRAVDVARLATLVTSIPAKGPVRIDLERGGRVCLNIGNGRVEFGDLTRMEEKVAFVEKGLREDPNLFTGVQTLNLVYPDAPTFQPRKGPPNL
jgi:cell division protein FtsQ